MKISTIEVFKIDLPFRFAFGHSLATRASSTNLIVRVRLDDGTSGYGEGIPRQYVTGEDIDSACDTVRSIYAPKFINLDVSSLDAVVAFLKQQFQSFGLDRKSRGASWCALELAVLDAVARARGLAISRWLGPPIQKAIRYGAVVPFGSRKALMAILAFYKLYGFQTVKVKVGGDLEEDIAKVRLVRQFMGPQATVRVDANCAWTPEQSLAAAERLRQFQIVSIEQPVMANDIAGLARVTSDVPEEVVADESLCTLEQAVQLAEMKACNAFNIRISKVGGLLAAQEMAKIAHQHGIRCHLGAQVGESGILSASGRIFACINEPFANYEGSDNKFLLQQDLTREDLTVGWRGYAKVVLGAGLGVTVNDRLLTSLQPVSQAALKSSSAT